MAKTGGILHSVLFFGNYMTLGYYGYYKIEKQHLSYCKSVICSVVSRLLQTLLHYMLLNYTKKYLLMVLVV